MNSDRVPVALLAATPSGQQGSESLREIDGREIYLTYPEGSGRSKLTIEVFERAFVVVATARNLNTVRALADLA